MTVRKGTYFKALLLLLVFSLNTVVSLACSFSSFFHGLHHHNNKKSPAEHPHASHHHHEKKSHHYQHKEVPTHQHSEESEGKKDDCCSANVLVLEKSEKAISKQIEAPARGFLTSLVYYYSYMFTPLLAENKILLFAGNRWRAAPTIQDLRIVIQSFQI